MFELIGDNGFFYHRPLIMPATVPADLSETAQLLLGAFALADVHTLTAAEVAQMSNNVIGVDKAADALAELAEALLAEAFELEEITAYRLTRPGLEVSLELQNALAQRTQH